MTIASGSYQSVVGGVSQQSQHKRKDGQFEEVVNMICDPLRGLARRQGMQRATKGSSTPTEMPVDEASKYHSFEYTCEGKDYVILYPTQAVSGATELYCFTKEHRDGGVEHIPVAGLGSSLALQAMQQHGVSAITQIGDLLLIAPNNFISSVSIDYRVKTQIRALVHVRAGAYSRTYQMRVSNPDRSAQALITYKTMASSYAGVLDTSDIDPHATDYQAQVNNRVHAYNTAVTQYVGQAAASIQPENIAAELARQINTDFPGNYATVSGSHILIDGLHVDWSSDGADGTQMIVVAPQVSNPALLPTLGPIGMVAEHVQAGKAVAYYEAVAATNSGQGDKLAAVTWQEAAGERVTLASPFVLGYVWDGQLRLGDIAANVGGSVPDINPPELATSRSGDTKDGANIPPLADKQITMLTVFQDRLLVGAGNTLTCSCTGDYLNFFQASTLQVEADDPIYFTGLSDDNDTLRYSTIFDRNLLLFGERQQYVISGRDPMDARSPLLTTAASYEGTTQCRPAQNGNFAFFSKFSRGSSSLHQFQFGAVSDSIQAFEASEMLDTYIKGTAVGLCGVTSPNFVFMRTTGLPNGLYVYTYLDTQEGGQRVFSAFSRWEWDEALGATMGICPANGGGLLVFTVMRATGSNVVQCDWISMESGNIGRPYLDRQYTHTSNDVHGSAVTAQVGLPGTASAYLPVTGTDGTVGVPYQSSFTLTNPYMKDYQGNVKLTGRLVVQRFLLRMDQTGGITGDVSFMGNTQRVLDFKGRKVGSMESLIGRQPIVDTTVSVLVGRANEEFTVTLGSVTWLPMTLTALEWSGQYFNHTR